MKIGDWEREDAQERRLLQVESWLSHWPLLNRLYCFLIIQKLGLTTPAAIFSFFWMSFFIFLAILMAVVCLLIVR
ncbi:MAG: hypothetical protein J5965_17450 [Aeriscardovia sp.]|nr:hypothetical protein [Aeriscardovia sp.]